MEAAVLVLLPSTLIDYCQVFYRRVFYYICWAEKIEYTLPILTSPACPPPQPLRPQKLIDPLLRKPLHPAVPPSGQKDPSTIQLQISNLY